MPTGIQYQRKHLNLADLDEPFDSRVSNMSSKKLLIGGLQTGLSIGDK